MEFILEPIPVVESFLSILLEVWNGSDYQGEVLGLMEHLSFQSFSGRDVVFLPDSYKTVSLAIKFIVYLS